MAKRDDDFKLDYDAEDSASDEEAVQAATLAPEASPAAADDVVTVSLPDGVSRVSTPVGTFSDGDEATQVAAEFVETAVAYTARYQTKDVVEEDAE